MIDKLAVLATVFTGMLAPGAVLAVERMFDPGIVIADEGAIGSRWTLAGDAALPVPAYPVEFASRGDDGFCRQRQPLRAIAGAMPHPGPGERDPGAQFLVRDELLARAPRHRTAAAGAGGTASPVHPAVARQPPDAASGTRSALLAVAPAPATGRWREVAGSDGYNPVLPADSGTP